MQPLYLRKEIGAPLTTKVTSVHALITMNSVILQTPLAMVLYGIAIGLCLFDRHYKATDGILTLVSTGLAIGATVYALALGAPLTECAIMTMALLLMNMGVKE